MASTRLGIALVFVALAVATFAHQPAAHAKGTSAIYSATLSGGGLPAPVTVPISLPENLDDMSELTPPAGPGASFLRYAITLHYDFGDEGGRNDWSGWFDGGTTLYFPDAMIVRNGVWAAGWYTAAPELARALASATAAADELLISPASGTLDTLIDVAANGFLPGVEVTFRVALPSAADPKTLVYSQPIAIQPANAAGSNEVQVYLRDLKGLVLPSGATRLLIQASTGNPARVQSGAFTLVPSGATAGRLPSTGDRGSPTTFHTSLVLLLVAAPMLVGAFLLARDPRAS